MKKLIKNVVAGLLSMGLLFTSTLPASASEINTIVLGSGSNSVRFAPGEYDITVIMKKAGAEDEDSMAVSALEEKATLKINNDGTVSVEVTFVQASIMGMSGVLTSCSIYQEHNFSSETNTVPVTVNSTFTYKPIWTSYTAIGNVEFNIPFESQSGVYADFVIQTSVTNMDQTGYLLFDFTPHRADYTSFDTRVSHYESVKNQYTTSSCLEIEEFLATVSYSEPKENQAVVDNMVDEITTLMEGMELRDVDVRDADITANIAVNEASYILEIPSEIGLGELSIEEDTAIPYEVSVEVLQGNNGTTTFQVSADTSGELKSGSSKLAYGNTFDTQTFTETQTVEAFFVITADTVAKAASGNYSGEVFFTIKHS